MHRVIMKLNFGDKRQVDHINGNGIDNRRNNLRICTQSQNNQNQRTQICLKSSKYKGVLWHKCCKRWMAQIKLNKKNKYIGLFKNEIDAAHAYDREAKELFGEYAKTNF